MNTALSCITGTSLVLYGAQRIYSDYENEKKYNASLTRLKNIEIFEETVHSKLASLSEASEEYRNFKLISDATLKGTAQTKATIRVHIEANKPHLHKKMLNIALLFGGAMILIVGFLLANEKNHSIIRDSQLLDIENSQLTNSLDKLEFENSQLHSQVNTLKATISYWEREKTYGSCLTSYCQCKPIESIKFDPINHACVKMRADALERMAADALEKGGQMLPINNHPDDCRNRISLADWAYMSFKNSEIYSKNHKIDRLNAISNQFSQLKSGLELSNLRVCGKIL